MLKLRPCIGTGQPAAAYLTVTNEGEQTVRVAGFRNLGNAGSLGFSLKEIDELIALYRDRRRTSRDVKRLALGHVEDLNRKIAELAAIRNVLLELAQKCRGDDRPECPILDELGSGASSVLNAHKAANK
jgi:MerR family transcriptional regulator, copper efflux regulator